MTIDIDEHHHGKDDVIAMSRTHILHESELSNVTDATDFCRNLIEQLQNLPPNSRFNLEAVTNAKGEIHNVRETVTKDRGPLRLRVAAKSK